MLAYQHGYHAGNHADVLKHVVLLMLLRHMNRKDKGYRVIDTHAGAGQYALDGPQALKTAEFRDGIGRLASRGDLPEPVADYMQQVRAIDPELQTYPGSPLLARALLRPQDELRLFELHPAEHAALAALFERAPRVEARQADGFAALKSQLPPPTRRALVLIDPSYEGRADYTLVREALHEALSRFAQGVYMVWYPLVGKPGAAMLIRDLKAMLPAGWLHARLSVQAPDAAGFGLLGSGVFVINPPHTLHAQLLGVLPWLAKVLAQQVRPDVLLEHLPR